MKTPRWWDTHTRDSLSQIWDPLRSNGLSNTCVHLLPTLLGQNVPFEEKNGRNRISVCWEELFFFFSLYPFLTGGHLFRCQVFSFFRVCVFFWPNCVVTVALGWSLEHHILSSETAGPWYCSWWLTAFPVRCCVGFFLVFFQYLDCTTIAPDLHRSAFSPFPTPSSPLRFQSTHPPP